MTQQQVFQKLCPGTVRDFMNQFVSKFDGQISPAATDLLTYLLELSCFTQQPLEDLFKALKKDRKKFELILQSTEDELLIKSFQNLFQSPAFEEALDTVQCQLKQIDKEFKELLLPKFLGYTFGFIKGVIDNPNLSCDEKLKEIDELVSD